MAQLLLSHRRNYLILLLITFIAVGSSAAVLKKQRENLLKERVTTYWNLRKKGLYTQTYKLEAKKIKDTFSLEKYIKLFGRILKIKEVSITQIKYKSSSQAQVKLKYCLQMLPIHKDICINYNDFWQWEKDNWYHCLKLKQTNKQNKGGEKKEKDKRFN